jgi:outer membrane lipoprotein-sorting protein
MTLKICFILGLVCGLGCGAAYAVDPTPEALHNKSGNNAAAPHGKMGPAPQPFVPMDPNLAIQKADDYFNQTTSMIADFVQIGGDGRRAEGKMFVQKPGKLRFEYAAPATLDIIADGTTVAVIDRKVGNIQPYFIWQTPLKFLLKEHIDLVHDTQVINVTSDPDNVTIQIQDKQVFGGPTLIKLMFDPATFTLKQWQVTDPQGNETLVSLFNQDFTTKPDPAVFQLYQSSSK